MKKWTAMICSLILAISILVSESSTYEAMASMISNGTFYSHTLS